MIFIVCKIDININIAVLLRPKLAITPDYRVDSLFVDGEIHCQPSASFH